MPTQYKAIIFYNNEVEKDLALKSKGEQEELLRTNLYVDIMPYKNFYSAENYHQKFYFKRALALYRELKSIYGTEKAITHSTAAGHINGYVKGYGSMNKLKSEIDILGLSEKGKNMLMDIVDAYS